jgi:hypothetical protein
MILYNLSFLLLPLFSFASTILDFNNLDVQNQIVDKATEELQVRLKRNGTSLSYLPFDQVPFTDGKNHSTRMANYESFSNTRTGFKMEVPWNGIQQGK